MALVFLSARANAQVVLQGTTPPGLLPGSPAGSYANGDFEHVNLFNGSLNIRLPLREISGRGDAHATMALAIQPRWTVKSPPDGADRPKYGWWPERQPGYGPGVLVGRKVADGAWCQGGGYLQTSLTRLTFTIGDGTEYELRNSEGQGQDGQPLSISCSLNLPNRGKTFVTSDGTAATFRSDTDIVDLGNGSNPGGLRSAFVYPSGELMLRDGTHYRIVDGSVTSMRDRNGNILTFAYELDATGRPRVKKITDSLLRVVTVDYSDSVDTISFKGFLGTARTLQVKRAPMHTVLVSGESIQTLSQLFPYFGGQQVSHDPQVVSEVVLPNGKSYLFHYNSYGEVGEVILPTGGSFRYFFDAGLVGGLSGGVVAGDHYAIYRRLIRRETWNGTSRENVMTYGRPETPTSNSGIVDVAELDGSENLLRRTEHSFFGSARDSLFLYALSYPAWKDGKEWRTVTYGPNDSLLRRSELTWEQGGLVPWWTQGQSSSPAKNPRVREQLSFLENGLVSKEAYEYGPYNNRTAANEYGFGVGAPGPLFRRTTTSFVATYNEASYDSDLRYHLRSLPLVRELFDGQGTLKARTVFEYDNYGPDPQGHHAALLDRANLTSHDPAFDHTWLPRGNVTSVAPWLDTANRSLPTFALFDVAGSVLKGIDARGFATDYVYAEHFGIPTGSATDDVVPPELQNPNGGTFKTHAFPSEVTNALGHKAITQYDYNLGRPVDRRDPNGVVATTKYDDLLERPSRQIEAALVSGFQTNTDFVYDDDNRVVHTYQDQDAARRLHTARIHDAFGRPFETQTYESATGYVALRTLVDPLGRAHKVSNPFRPGEGGPIWTVTDYDALDRVVAITTPDGASTNTSYDGPTTTVTDSANNMRRSVVDSQGRVVRIIEDPLSLAYETVYTYNVFDRIATVTQGVQTRAFVYDSLARLRRATNVESGVDEYDYDDSGNPISHRDGRGVVAAASFDALGRVQARSYSDVTPAVTYNYDASPDSTSYAKGRLASVSSSESTTALLVYDPLGRVTKSEQRTVGRVFGFEYRYDSTGALVWQKYPSGRTLQTQYDNAARPSRTFDALTTFASDALYWPHGAVREMKLGNGLWEASEFNVRLQPRWLGIGSLPSHVDAFLTTYDYGGTANNGNVKGMSVLIPGSESIMQGFSYDSLNRLQAATESGAWSQTYAYDRYGNRAVTTGYVSSPLTPRNLQAYQPGSNQIAGSQYDAAGNLTVDTLGRQFTYDANGRQKAFLDGAGLVQYIYDGEGRRVRVTTGGRTTLFAYDVFGHLAGEYSDSTPPAGPTLEFLTADALGTPRISTDASGHVVARHDYLPFGEEIPATLGGRGSIPGYGVSDGIRHQFTSKERDAESGLDYFLARYYSGAQGRFLSPDSFSGGAVDLTGGRSDSPVALPYADLRDPRTLNKYAYVLNNPLRFTDPDGHKEDGGLWQTFIGWVNKLNALSHPSDVVLPTEHQNPEAQSGALDDLPRVRYKTGGTPPPETVPGPLAEGLQCVADCLNEDLRVTSTSEPIWQHGPTTSNRHGPRDPFRHPADPHGMGLAADVTVASQPQPTTLQMNLVGFCTRSCGFHNFLNEYRHLSTNGTAGHFHLQIPPGVIGPDGQGHRPFLSEFTIPVSNP